MNPQPNPYSSPRAQVEAVLQPLEIVNAGRWRRFFGYLIDTVALSFVGAVLGAALILILRDRELNLLESSLLNLGVMLGYYVLLESLFGCTVGKLLVGTRVVNEQGVAPSAGQALGRTLARMLPFEAFAIFSVERRTVHDSLTGTHVVRTR